MKRVKFKLKKKISLLLITVLITVSTAFSQSRVNLGLYGGAATDLAYMQHGSLIRVFAGVQSPASLFYSDNDGAMWQHAFPIDSLEFKTTLAPGQTFGWGGGGRKIVTNSNGWVGVLTQQYGGTLSAAVLNTNDGTPGFYFTFVDNFYLKYDHPSAGPATVTAIAMNDNDFFAAIGSYIYKSVASSSSANGISRTTLADLSTVTGMPSTPAVLSLAVSNSSTGYPMYLVVGNSPNDNMGDLYKYDGTTFTLMTLPLSLKVQRVFTHPAEATGSKVILSCIDPSTNNLSVYVSTNGGSTWTDRTPSVMGSFALTDVEYSSAWTSSMTSSNGMRIVLPGKAYSDDLGNTWSTLSLVDNSFTTRPDDPQKIMGTMGYGPVFSTNGAAGPFNLLNNVGLEAVNSNKIAKYTISPTNAIYYLSTTSGLAYTDAYYNNSVPYPMKWKSPHGAFPLPNVGDDAGIGAVAIDPNNQNHVIAGFSNGFSVTTSGPTGFSNVYPSGWNSTAHYDQMVTDIKFVNSNIIIATTGSRFNDVVNGYTTGNIWRSADGGSSWSKVTPMGLEQPNCVAVGSAGGTKVLYVGAGHATHDPYPVNGSLWKSTDLGLTWTKINDGPNSIVSAATKLPIYDIVVKNGTTNVLFIAAGKNLDHAFVYSTNGGASYNYTSVTGEGEFTSVFQYDADKFFVANRREIFNYDYSTGAFNLQVKLMPGEFAPDMEKGSLVFATNTGVYKIEVDSTGNGIGTANPKSNDDLTVIPNPNNGSFKINKNINGGLLKIYDTQGKTVFEDKVNGKSTIKPDGLSDGLYLLQLNCQGKIYSMKMLVRH